jgi:transposase
VSDLAIVTLAELVDDIERVRIATGNRVGALERTFGSSLPHLDAVLTQLQHVEDIAERELRRAWRQHSLAAWAKSIAGLGEPSIARLIAVIGDPAERSNPAKLWAYCGHGDPARSRLRRGAGQDELLARGSPEAKKRVWLIARQFVRTPGSPYRAVYDAARAKYADRVHASPCARCGPRGQPAQAGSPWSPGHQHAAAIRAVGKAFLVDLWRAARSA